MIPGCYTVLEGVRMVRLLGQEPLELGDRGDDTV